MTSDPEEQELIRRAAAGDERCVQTLFTPSRDHHHSRRRDRCRGGSPGAGGRLPPKRASGSLSSRVRAISSSSCSEDSAMAANSRLGLPLRGSFYHR